MNVLDGGSSIRVSIVLLIILEKSIILVRFWPTDIWLTDNDEGNVNGSLASFSCAVLALWPSIVCGVTIGDSLDVQNTGGADAADIDQLLHYLGALHED